tara:strand:- start:1373 stop:1651 length:279 start_codon:yes stop_codon:yes gene_type:complete
MKKPLTEKSLRADLYAGLCEAKTEIRLLKEELEVLKLEDSFITVNQYKADIIKRWQVHQKEVKAAGCDIAQAWKWGYSQVDYLRAELQMLRS